MKQETQVFNCEKCEHELPSLGSLMKHIRKGHDVGDLALVLLNVKSENL